jgi:excisionase family DNA binding protein
VTIRQAAARLEVSPATVYNLVAEGKLRCVRIGVGRGVIRILDEHIAEYLGAAAPKPAMAPVSAAAAPPRLKHIRLRSG